MYVLLLAAGARLSFETDAIVIGAVLGVAAIPFYTVANSLVVYLVDFTLAIAAVVSPMATRLDTAGRREELTADVSEVVEDLAVVDALCRAVSDRARAAVHRLVDRAGVRAAGGRGLEILMISCFAFLPVRGVALPILMGLGKPRAPTIAFLGAGVMNLVMSLALAKPFGLVGVAVGTAIPNVTLRGLRADGRLP